MRSLTWRLALLAIGICALLAPASALATSSEEAILHAKTKGTEYLEGLQEKSGGFKSDWDLDSIAAAGTAAANLKIAGAATNARSWYQELVGNLTATKWPEKAIVTEYERAALVGYAAGIDPARFSKTENMFAGIASFYEPSSPGYYGPPGNFNGTVFALLAFTQAKTESGVQRVPNALLKKTVEVVEKNQHTDGGWSWEKAEGNTKKLEAEAEPDMTGAAMAALCGAGATPATSEAVKKGEAYLKKLLLASTGGFKYAEGGENTDSNAWGVQGLDACKIEPQGTEFTTTAGKTPIDFLISQQLSSPLGAFQYSPEKKGAANEYSSQDAVRALAGAAFTVTPPVPTGGLKQWEQASEFAKGKESPLMLVIKYENEPLKVCSVSVSPTTETAETVSLEKVFVAAEKESGKGSTPVSCVTGHTSEAGGAITQINGFPSTPTALWEYSIDGGAEKQATLTTKIHLGDTIYLNYN
jgi:hypothetical protein